MRGSEQHLRTQLICNVSSRPLRLHQVINRHPSKRDDYRCVILQMSKATPGTSKNKLNMSTVNLVISVGNLRVSIAIAILFIKYMRIHMRLIPRNFLKQHRKFTMLNFDNKDAGVHGTENFLIQQRNRHFASNRDPLCFEQRPTLLRTEKPGHARNLYTPETRTRWKPVHAGNP